MGNKKQHYVIADLTAWSRLQTTDVRHLSFRAWVGRGDELLTSTDDMTDDEHHRYIKSLPFGVKQITPLKGSSPVASVLADDDTLARIARGLASEEISLGFFEAQAAGPEIELVAKLGFLSGVRPDEIWRRANATHPSLSRLGSKLAQRRLARQKEVNDLFLPWQTAAKNEDSITAAAEAMVDATGAQRILVRVDGEASGDGQAFYPDLDIAEITRRMNSFSADEVMVEPAVHHRSASALLNLTDAEVEIRALTLQLQSYDEFDVGGSTVKKATWCGNWVYTPFDECAMSEASASSAAAAGLTIGELLRAEGVRGHVSVDLLLLDEDLPRLGLYRDAVMVTEANVRETNGSYAYDALVQQRAHHGACTGGIMVCKPATDEFRCFSDLKKLFGSLLYTGGRPHGLIPIVTGTLPGQLFLGIIAPTPGEYMRLTEQAWNLLKCPGSVPGITSRAAISVGR